MSKLDAGPQTDIGKHKEQPVSINLQPLPITKVKEIWDLFQSVRNDPEMIRLLPLIEQYMNSKTEFTDFIMRSIVDHQKTTRAIIFNGKIAGLIVYSPSGENPDETSVGYFLGAGFTGKGIAKAALLKVSQDLEARKKRPVVHISPANSKSIHLATSVGYVKTSRNKYKGMDVYTFKAT